MGCLLGLQEGTLKVVNVDEFDVSTVQRMISFLYTGEYQISPNHDPPQLSSVFTKIEASGSSLALPQTEGAGTVETLLSHLRVNAIADYYDIQSLARLVNSKILSILEKSQDAEMFPRFIQEASTSTRDAALHSIIASTTANRMEELTGPQTFLNMELERILAMEILRACGTRIRELQSQLKNAQRLRASETLYQSRNRSAF
ncbi:hypothetical protein IL306_013816 [Fusarium sp. DS 682]|nr:hypothetical protein IL306_013816 [Fusarium sp. DS 682]